MNKITVDVLAETVVAAASAGIDIDWNDHYDLISSAAEPTFTIDQFMFTHFPNLTLDQLKHIISLHPEASL
jgi:hypothetical protein